MYAEAKRLQAARGWGDDDPHALLLLHLFSNREDARQSLRSKIESLRHDLHHLESALQSPSPLLNSLGELQGRPSAVEAGVGEFTAADRALRLFLETFPEPG
jgi:hypothetical protein